MSMSEYASGSNDYLPIIRYLILQEPISVISHWMATTKVPVRVV